MIFSVVLILLSLFFSGQAMARDQRDDLFNFANKREQALVVKVSDSDRIVLEDGRRVKLIGVESVGPVPYNRVERDVKGIPIRPSEGPIVPLEEQAITYAEDLMEGVTVTLEHDIVSLDEYGRPLAYVFLPDGRLANAELVRQGFVHLRIQPPNIRYEDQLRQAYREAKQEQRGFLGD